ncbi:MAG: helix-turn-helix domain-containing protein [Gallintestinimicrobium sp.]
MEQKHTLEENGYYAQVTDQLIENIGYQMIRRNWSMKTLADKADLPYETVKHLMAGKIGRPSFISILKIANALECSLDDLAGRNNPALEALRRLADHADGMYQIFAEVEHLLYPNFMMQRKQQIAQIKNGMIKSTVKREESVNNRFFLSQNVHNRLQIVQLLIGGNRIY